jgi:hypothetical protein
MSRCMTLDSKEATTLTYSSGVRLDALPTCPAAPPHLPPHTLCLHTLCRLPVSLAMFYWLCSLITIFITP